MIHDKFRKLSELGAGAFAHIDGSLLEHLNGTRDLLEEWSASPALQDAGLYHAAYGTAGFDERLVSVDQRGEIAAIIGAEAEEIVYQYCACDRGDFYPRLEVDSEPEFRNRFTGERYHLDNELLQQFCELTAANETEIAIDNPVFIADHGVDLYRLFHSMAPYLSEPARSMVEVVFRSGNG